MEQASIENDLSVNNIDTVEELKKWRLTREGLKSAVNDISTNLKKPWKSLPTVFLLQKPNSPVRGVTTINEVWRLINDIEGAHPVETLESLIVKRSLKLADGTNLFATSNK